MNDALRYFLGKERQCAHTDSIWPNLILVYARTYTHLYF